MQKDILLKNLTQKHIAESDFRLPLSQDDGRVRAVAEKRRDMLRCIMAENDIAGYVVTRRDNFAWLSCGGMNNVMLNSEMGTAHILLTQDRQYLLAYTMDADRILDEQLAGQGYDSLRVQWYQGDPREAAGKLVAGRLASDTEYPGTELFPIGRLHGMLYDVELDRCRWIGAQTNAMYLELIKGITPGMRESEIARLFHAALIYHGIMPEVLITGSEGRTNRYYHALPSDKTANEHILLHAASSRWGLHANVNRLICFGRVDGTTSQFHRAAATVHANVLSALRPGVKYASILELEKRAYAECGFPDEWRKHYQGGETGYVIGDADLCFTELTVSANKAFDWFLTVGGIQTEELSLLTDNGLELASVCGGWPVFKIDTSSGTVEVPDIAVI